MGGWMIEEFYAPTTEKIIAKPDLNHNNIDVIFAFFLVLLRV